MKLYSSPFSPNAFRTRAVTFELGLEPEIIDVNIGKGENRTPEYLAINPNGKVPALVDGEVVLWESRAINGYLASKKPQLGLYPTDPAARALVDQWSYWQAIHLGPSMQKVAFERVLKKLFGRGEADEATIVGDLKTVADLLPILDAALAGKQWVTGSLTLADFAIASTFVYRRPARLGVEDHANVASWIERLEARPSWQRAVAPIKAWVTEGGVEL
jgi:glutathione S-transferase